MRTAKRIKCSGCGRRMPACEPDLALRKAGSEYRRYYHERCVAAAQKLILSDPALWWMTHRHIDGRLN